MDTNKKNKTIIDNLDDIELDLLRTNDAYAKQFLTDEGIDPEKEIEFANQFMRKIRFMATGLANKKRDIRLLDLAFDRLKEVISVNSTKASDVLVNLLHQKTPAVHYRKLENWTDDEIRDVLSDIDLVKLMEELKNE